MTKKKKAKLINTDKLRLDSDVFTRWRMDVADAEREVGKPFKQQAQMRDDGSLILLAANDEMQLAMKVDPGQWAHPDFE